MEGREKPMMAASAAPTYHSRWTMKYDEEWAQGLALSHLRKRSADTMELDPEPMPRVWNTPRK